MYYDSAIDKLLFQNMSDREQFDRMNHLDIELSSGDAPQSLLISAAGDPESRFLYLLQNGNNGKKTALQ